MNLITLNARSGRVSFSTGPVLDFTQDQEIYGQGDPAEIFLKVVTGVVRTCRFLNDGRRQIDAFHVPGDVFGFEFGTEHSLSAEAVNDCTVISYRWRGLAAFQSGTHGLTEQLCGHAMRNLARAQDHSMLLGRSSALEKMAAFLVEWSGHSVDRRLINLAMSRHDVADYLGLTVETISRTLTQLRQSGFIELPSARQIKLIDLTGLRAMNN